MLNIKERLKPLAVHYLQQSLVRNLGWLTLAQVLNKFTRLAATVLIARILLPEQYGYVALILTVHDIVGAIIRRSTQTSLVNANKENLDVLCHQAYRLNWFICLLATVLQVIIGFLIAWIYQEPVLWLPICTLALVHLQLPLGMVQASLNIRQQKLKLVAKIDVLQTIAETALIIALLVSGVGFWSLVIAKILVVPIWTLMHRHHCHWNSKQPVRHLTSKLHWQSTLVIITDALQIFKNNMDYLLVGYFWGAESLGIYYFAYNAGVGIGSAFSQAAGTALFPHLCKHQHDPSSQHSEFKTSMLLVLTVTSLICMAQCLLAHWYVPLVFGKQWVELGAIPILIALCISVLPRAILEQYCQLLRARGQLRYELVFNTVLTFLLGTGVLLSLKSGLMQIAITISAVYGTLAILVLGLLLCYPTIKTSASGANVPSSPSNA